MKPAYRLLHSSMIVSRKAFYTMSIHRLLFCICAILISIAAVLATSNYEYGRDEYVTVNNGISPDGKFAITAHGEGEYGDENFHIYLTDAITGKKIGPLEEIVETLDTGADAFCAKWSQDSQDVVIVYRVDRHAPLKAVSYHISNRRARRIKGPYDVKNNELATYWQRQCSQSKLSPKIFGTPLKHD
jgi:hypothetical protein